MISDDFILNFDRSYVQIASMQKISVIPCSNKNIHAKNNDAKNIIIYVNRCMCNLSKSQKKKRNYTDK